MDFKTFMDMKLSDYLRRLARRERGLPQKQAFLMAADELDAKDTEIEYLKQMGVRGGVGG